MNKMTKWKQILDSTAIEVKRLGFRKRSGGFYTCDLDNDFLGVLSLTKTKRGDVLAVSPFVGIRHQVMERLIAEFEGEKPHSYTPVSFFRNIGDLIPSGSYTVWEFPDDRVFEKVKDYVHLFEQFGIPFIQQSASLDRLEELIRDGMFEAFNRTRLPLIKALKGDMTGAVELCNYYLDLISGKDDVASVVYRKFAQKFLERYS